jgi:hypothetical protein
VVVKLARENQVGRPLDTWQCNYEVDFTETRSEDVEWIRLQRTRPRGVLF